MIGTFEILMNLNDGETAQKGTNANEVVIAISPAFGKNSIKRL